MIPVSQTRGMSESEAQTILILLYVVSGVLVLLAILQFGLRRRLSRIERLLLEKPDSRGRADSAYSAAETSAGGAFESFLSEDSARRNLPKGEQLAEYRRWRQEKGLNWSNS